MVVLSFLVPPGNYSLSLRIRTSLPPVGRLPSQNHVTGLQLGVAEGVEVQGTVLDQTGRP